MKTFFVFVWSSIEVGDKLLSIFGEDLFFGLKPISGTASKLEAKFPLNFIRNPNTFGQGCESVPHAKFYSLSTVRWYRNMSSLQPLVFLDNLSFSSGDSFLQLITFTYQILRKDVFKVRRFGSAMQLIIHDWQRRRSNTWCRHLIHICLAIFFKMIPLFSIQC